jgi:hypothetical protein
MPEVQKLHAYRTVRYRFGADDGHVFAVRIYTLINVGHWQDRPIKERRRWRERWVWLEVQPDGEGPHWGRSKIVFGLSVKTVGHELWTQRHRLIDRTVEEHRTDWWGWKLQPDPAAAATFEQALHEAAEHGNTLALRALAGGSAEVKSHGRQ